MGEGVEGTVHHGRGRLRAQRIMGEAVEDTAHHGRGRLRAQRIMKEGKSRKGKAE